MKRVFTGKIITLLLASFLSFGFAYGMEENTSDTLSSYKEPAALKIPHKGKDIVVLFRNTLLEDQNIIKALYYAFSDKIDKKLTSTPKTFYEAIVHLHCVAKILEKSLINPTVLGKNFNITPYECQITVDGTTYTIPHDILHPIFDSWCQKARTKIFIEHPKSIAAATIILNTLSNNVTLDNLEDYKKAIAILPSKAKKYIEEKFVEKYGWKIKDLKIELDNNGNIAGIQFTIDNFLIKGNRSIGRPYVGVLDMTTLECVSSFGDMPLSMCFHYTLGKFFNIYSSQSEIESLQDFLVTKPTFERVLLNHAHNHKEKTLLDRIKQNASSLTSTLTNLFNY